jgi:hypothetical protein
MQQNMRNKEDMNSRQTHEVKNQIIKSTAKESKQSMVKNNYMLDDSIKLTLVLGLRGQGGLEFGSPLSEVPTCSLESSSYEFNNHINFDSSVSDINMDLKHVTHPPPTPPPTLAAAFTLITASVRSCHASRTTPSTVASVCGMSNPVVRRDKHVKL